jgi:hypothetical protein
MYNINPALWGKHAWPFLHYISLSYPENPNKETQELFRDFFINIIWKFLPCEKCRYNYKKHLEELPLTDDILKSRNKFIYWLVDIHNIVNEETGKRKITYDEFNKMYINAKEEEIKTTNFSFTIIIFLIITLIILFIVYRKL